MLNEKDKIAEVTESSSDSFYAQCYQLYQAPDFGSVVKVIDGSITIYAVCLHVKTAGLDPNRRPTARGQNCQNEEEIYQQNPQLAQLLQTEFKAQVFAHKQNDTFKSYLPPQATKIHAFVYIASRDECHQLAHNLDFMRYLLYGNLDINNDEVTAALLRFLSKTQDSPQAFLEQAGLQAASLILNDAARLKFFLRRLDH